MTATNLQAQVLALWQQVLPQMPDPDTHFFLAGGDSLQLHRLLTRVRESLGYELQLQDLAHFSTPRKMTQWCERLTATNVGESMVDTAVIGDSYPASSSQQGLWWSEQRAGECGLYNSAVQIEIAGELQVPLLAAALALTLEHFPMLASCLVFEGRRRQLVVRLAEVTPSLGEIVSIPYEEVVDYAAAWAATPFELAHNVFRCCLLQHHPQHHSLLVCVHHCVMDGWSGRLLLQQLAQAYSSLTKNPQWQPPPAETAFARHCLRQQQMLGTDGYRSSLDWWQQYLQAFNNGDAALPWTARATHWPYRVRHASFSLSAALMKDLQRLCVRCNCTLFAALATAMTVALSKSGDSKTCVIGFPAAHRHSRDEEASVGCYMQLLPLGCECDCNQPLQQLLVRNQLSLQGVLAHTVPLPALVAALRPQPMADGNPWFNVVLALQNFPLMEPDWGGLETVVRPVPSDYGQYLLQVEMEGCHLIVAYAFEIIPASEVQAIVLRMQELLAQMASAVQ